MSPASFWAGLRIALATGSLLTFTWWGLAIFCLVVAWLLLPRSKPSDDILAAIGEGRIRGYSPEQLRAKNRMK